MRLKVCFIGKTRSGTWTIRAEQIAAMRPEWHAEPDLDKIRPADFDIFCVVKRPPSSFIEELKRRNKIVVYDVLDSWRQPDDGLAHTDLPAVRRYFESKVSRYSFDALIFPDLQMKRDLGHLAPYGTVLYHHYRPGMDINPIREEARTIGYEGNERYLGHWKDVLEEICRAEGMVLKINPRRIADIDIGFAGRGGAHDSFMANRYKSNVKLANFYGTGTPCVVSRKEIAYHETDNGLVRFFETPKDLHEQILALKDHSVRRKVRESFLEHRRRFEIRFIADQYEHFFSALYRRKASHAMA